jgi:excisionase family DNA binding protein
MQILDHFYTESQAAKELGINRITIWRWIKSGRFNIQRIGKVVFIPKWEIDIIKSQQRVK